MPLTVTIRHPIHLSLVLIASFAIYSAGPFLGEVLRFSRWDEGFANGVFYVIIGAFAWLLFCLPLSLLIYGVCRWRCWTRFRTFAILAPVLVATGVSVVTLLSGALTPANQFHGLTGIRLPATDRDTRHWLAGGGWDGTEDTLFFRCCPEDTEALISALKLVPVGPDSVRKLESCFTPHTPDWPDSRTWPGRIFYYTNTESEKPGSRAYTLCTDGSRENVYFYTDPY